MGAMPRTARAGPEGEAAAPRGTIYIIWTFSTFEIHADIETNPDDEAWLTMQLDLCGVETLPAPQDEGGVRVWTAPRQRS